MLHEMSMGNRNHIHIEFIEDLCGCCLGVVIYAKNIGQSM